jgi:uncharacterized protein involved in type VI secretion and phage assembly
MIGDKNNFLGKFRGIVARNNDDLGLGRLLVKVPDVLGNNASGWALPCLPYAGKGVGLFLLPPVGASVWVEFEHGDPEYPVWCGCFWGSKEDVPANPAAANMKILQTESGSITIDDSAESITIQTKKDGMKIVIDHQGIEIDDARGGKIKLDGTRVSVNDGALEVI